MGKITLKEFWEMGEKGIEASIHCNTEEKANKILAAFDKMGKRWRDGERYSEINYWYFPGNCDGLCYVNNRTWRTFKADKSRDCKTYEFEDIIFDGNKTTDYPKIAQIRMPNGKNYYYALYDENIKRKNYVLVTGKAAEKILKVTAVYGAENRPSDCPENLTQEVICGIDMKPYKTRVRARHRKRCEEISSLTKEINKLREKLLQDYLGQNEEYKFLTAKLEELKKG